MAVLSLVNYYFRPMLISQLENVIQMQTSGRLWGKISSILNEQKISRCGCDPETCTDRKEKYGRGKKYKEPGILTVLFMYEINNLENCLPPGAIFL